MILNYIHIFFSRILDLILRGKRGKQKGHEFMASYNNLIPQSLNDVN